MNEAPVQSSKGVLSHGLMTAGAQAMNSLASYFSILIIINALGENRFGIFAYTMVITAITTMVADFGMNPILLRSMAQHPGKTKQVLLEATVLRSLLLLPAILITNVVALVQHQPAEFFILANILLINTVISAKMPIIRGTFESFFRARAKMSIPAMLALLDSCILLGLALAYRNLFTSPLSAMIAYTASNLIGGVALLVWSFVVLKAPSFGTWRMEKSSMKHLLRESAPLALFLVLNAVQVQFDFIYVDMFFTKSDVGIYNAAFRLLVPLLTFPTMAGWALVPFIARLYRQNDAASREKITTLYSMGMKSLALFACAVAMIGYFDSSTLVRIAFRGKYTGAVVPTVIFFFSYIFVAMNLFQVEINNALGLQRRNTQVAFIMLIVSLLPGYFIIRDYGINGAAGTKLVAAAIGFVFLFALFQRELHWRFASSFLRITGISAASFMVGFFIPTEHALIRVVLVAGCFFTGALVTGFFSTEERQIWRSQISGMLQFRKAGAR